MMQLIDVDLLSVVAMSAPADPNANPLGLLLPFALVLGIFYFIILMPMRQRQKKIAEFQSGLKEGDKVVTTGGIHGQVTKVVSDTVVQLQIAEKVRINIAKAAIGGYQGQEPVVPESGSGNL